MEVFEGAEHDCGVCFVVELLGESQKDLLQLGQFHFEVDGYPGTRVPGYHKDRIGCLFDPKDTYNPRRFRRRSNPSFPMKFCLKISLSPSFIVQNDLKSWVCGTFMEIFIPVEVAIVIRSKNRSPTRVLFMHLTSRSILPTHWVSMSRTQLALVHVSHD